MNKKNLIFLMPPCNIFQIPYNFFLNQVWRRIDPIERSKFINREQRPQTTVEAA